jgi:hypothetical protein
MDERRVRPRRLRHGRRLNDGTVVVTRYDDRGRVTHAIRYDESMEHVLEELEGEAAEDAYGGGGSDEIDSPLEPGADYSDRGSASRAADGEPAPELPLA